MLNLALTSDFPSTPNAAVAARIRIAAEDPRVAWVAPQSSLTARTRFLAAQPAFGALGVRHLDYCSADEDAGAIRFDQYDAVYLTGGDPLIFQRNIRRADLGQRLREFMDSGRLVVAASGGAMQLTANVSLFRLQSNTVDEVLSSLEGFDGLHVVGYEILPHLNSHDASFMEKVLLYSKSLPHDILALADGAALVYVDGKPGVVGDVVRFSRGVRKPLDQWFAA